MVSLFSRVKTFFEKFKQKQHDYNQVESLQEIEEDIYDDEEVDE